MTPDDKELARCIHETAVSLQALLEQVEMKYPGKQGAQWVACFWSTVDKLIDETREENR